ncbi:hypothetical protein F5Y18DRAFT_193867 [Xylariaceae sp. FL1019]|nr:hypothetical protein F5Y18DRAFT_193867 [Xylariaceae sp. FL1019]
MTPSTRKTPNRTSVRRLQSVLAGSSPRDAICIDSEDGSDDQQTLAPTPTRGRKVQQKAKGTVSSRAGARLFRDGPCLTVARTVRDKPPISGQGCLSRHDTDAHRVQTHGTASLVLAPGANAAAYGSTAQSTAQSITMPHVVQHHDDVVFVKEQQSPRTVSHLTNETSSESTSNRAMARLPLSIHTTNASHSPLTSSHKLTSQYRKQNMTHQMQSSPLASGAKPFMPLPSLTTSPSTKSSSSTTLRTIPSTPARKTLPHCTLKTPSSRGTRRDPYEIPSDSDSDDSRSQHDALPRSFAKIRSATLGASENAKPPTLEDAEEEENIRSVLRDAHTWLKVSPLLPPRPLSASAPQAERFSIRNCPSPDASPLLRATRPTIPRTFVPFTPPVVGLKQEKRCEDERVEDDSTLVHIGPLAPRQPSPITSKATTTKARYQNRIDQYFAANVPGSNATVTSFIANKREQESIANQTRDVDDSVYTEAPTTVELVRPTSETLKRRRQTEHEAATSILDSSPGSPVLRRSDIAVSPIKKRPRDMIDLDLSIVDDPVARMGKKFGIDPDKLPDNKKKKHRRRGKRFRKHKWDELPM